jgi:peptidoglycan/xylan/chitin deacetylase (PgdA/CDA1 family)
VTRGPRVALTFDAEHPDRPNDGDRTDAILRALAAAGARATFFLQGRWVEAAPERARAIPAAGHLVGSHSHYHARMPLFSADGLRADLADARTAIVEHVGIDPRPWFRAPFGAGAEQGALVDRLAELGYRHVGWHVAAKEWEPGRTVREVADAIVDGVRAHGDGAIVLLHTWPSPVTDALADVFARLGRDGVRWVGVDELDLSPGLAPIAEPQPAPAA